MVDNNIERPGGRGGHSQWGAMLFLLAIFTVSLMFSWFMAIRSIQGLNAESAGAGQGPEQAVLPQDRDGNGNLPEIGATSPGVDDGEGRQAAGGMPAMAENDARRGAMDGAGDPSSGIQAYNAQHDDAARIETHPDDAPAHPSVQARKPVEAAQPQPQSAARTIPPQPLDGATPSPYYPVAALREGKKGSVRLNVLVNEAGKPRQVTVARSSGVAELDRAAAQAIYDWRFRPGTVGGKPVSARTQITIDFDPEG